MIVLCIGTRPDIIKVAPVHKALKELQADFCVYHTNQHRNNDMSRVFLDQFGFDADSISYADVGDPVNPAELYARVLHDAYNRFGIMVKYYGKVLVCVYGDGIGSLACGMAAKNAGATLVHIEAGYRGYDITIPEEMNRMILDSQSSILFVPTAIQQKNLQREQNPGEIIVSGNTITDVVNAVIKSDEYKNVKNVFDDGTYVLATFHRPENVDDRFRLIEVVKNLGRVGFRVLWPVHPRTMKKIKSFCIEIPENVETIDPLPYARFLRAVKGAAAIVTDSGGIQEETLILEKPCIVIRRSTERPETLVYGFHKLHSLDGSHGKSLCSAVIEVIDRLSKIKEGGMGVKNPYGSDVGKLIANKLLGV